LLPCAALPDGRNSYPWSHAASVDGDHVVNGMVPETVVFMHTVVCWEVLPAPDVLFAGGQRISCGGNPLAGHEPMSGPFVELLSAGG
jgi:hypothetical protein